MQDRIALLLPHKENFSKDSINTDSMLKCLNQKSKYINTLDFIFFVTIAIKLFNIG